MDATHELDREPTAEEMQADRDLLMSAIGEAFGDFALGCDGPDGLTSGEWDDLFASMADDE